MSPTPPELPSTRFYTPGVILSWIVIGLVAVAMLARHFLPQTAEEDSAPSENGVVDSGSNMVFELQTKMMIGISTVGEQFGVPHYRSQAQDGADNLAETVSTPGPARTVAGLLVYLDREANRERALTLLDDSLAGGNPSEAHAAARQAVDDPAGLTEAQQQLLETKLGYTGQVLLASFEAQRRPAIGSEGMKLFALFAFALLGGFAIFVTGLVFLILAIVRFKSGKLQPRFRTASRHAPVYFEAFAVYLLMMILGSLGLQFLLTHFKIGGDLWMALPVPLAALAGLVWPLLRGVSASQARQDLGLHRGAGFFRELGAGIAGYCAIIPIFVAGAIIAAVLVQLANHTTGAEPKAIEHPINEWLDRSWIYVAMAFVLASIAAPLVEEVMFRGALHRGLRARWPRAVAVLVIAFIFGIVHPYPLVALPVIMSLAIGLALIREWRDSLIAPMVAHGLHNSITLFVVWSIFP